MYKIGKCFKLGVLPLLLSLLACEQDAKLDLPEKKPELVIAAFLSPEDEVRVKLSRTYNIYGNIPSKPEMIQNAVVKIYSDTDTATLSFNAHPDSMFYQIIPGNLHIIPGKNYKLYAEAPGYPAISSSCTVPDSLSKEISYTLERHLNGNGDSSYRLNIAWLDIPGRQNYYRVMAEIVDTISGLSGIKQLKYLVFFNHEEIDDNGRDGALLQTGYGEAILYQQSVLLHRHLVIYLVTCEPNYFSYHRSLSDYSGIDPFTEPYNIFSNISGGKGIFSAYRSYIHRQKIF
jgi:hypothetical protein